MLGSLTLDGWGQIAAIAAGVVVVGGVVIGMVRQFIKTEIHEVRSEFHPNGGGSFRDHLDRRLDGIDGRLNGIDGRLNNQQESIARCPFVGEHQQ